MLAVTSVLEAASLPQWPRPARQLRCWIAVRVAVEARLLSRRRPRRPCLLRPRCPPLPAIPPVFWFAPPAPLLPLAPPPVLRLPLDPEVPLDPACDSA